MLDGMLLKLLARGRLATCLKLLRSFFDFFSVQQALKHARALSHQPMAALSLTPRETSSGLRPPRLAAPPRSEEPRMTGRVQRLLPEPSSSSRGYSRRDSSDSMSEPTRVPSRPHGMRSEIEVSQSDWQSSEMAANMKVSMRIS